MSPIVATAPTATIVSVGASTVLKTEETTVLGKIKTNWAAFKLLVKDDFSNVKTSALVFFCLGAAAHWMLEHAAHIIAAVI